MVGKVSLDNLDQIRPHCAHDLFCTHTITIIITYLESTPMYNTYINLISVYSLLRTESMCLSRNAMLLMGKIHKYCMI